MSLHIVLLLVGLLGLWIGSERVVDAGKALALRFGVSQLLIGLTIVSIGASLPEIMVSVFSGIRDADDLAVGAMIGSCLTQITLILGIAGIIHNIHIRRKALRVDGTMLLFSIMLFALFLFTGMRLTPMEGAILITVYVIYIWYTLRHDDLRAQAVDRVVHRKKGWPLWGRLFEIALGIVILVYSADLVLDHVSWLARSSGLSEAFIGVMIVGTATGLPELSIAIMGAVRKAEGISIGSLIGSNITDPLLSMGLGALFGGFSTNPTLLKFDIPFWFIASSIALLLLHSNKLNLTKYEGASLVLIYVIFVMTKVL